MEKLWLMQAAVRSCVFSELLKGYFAKGNFNFLCINKSDDNKYLYDWHNYIGN